MPRHSLISALMGLLCGLLLIALFASSSAEAQQGYWLAEFFNNRYLLDPPALTRRDSRINFDWGGGAPADGVNADGFSARWTRTYTLGAGTYQMSGSADDGMRVKINGVEYIDAFNLPAGRANNVTFRLMAGDYTIEVEFYDVGGNAFINFSFGAFVPPTAPPTHTALPGVTPSFAPATIIPTLNLTGPTITVATGRLNVRSGPALDARVVAIIERFERYPIVGRNTDSTWYQILVSNLRIVGTLVGWVAADFVFVDRAANVPVTYGFVGTPSATGYLLRTTATVNLRAQPSTESPSLGLVVAGVLVDILGRTAGGSWWFVAVGDTLGWMQRDFVRLEQDVDYGLIPIIGG
ncbi:MAG: SH3 domain-containing protein [Chloroflexi bacterium]|nr:SH3 domain-containing protein [Chloroflexota bacterium]